VAIAGGHCAAAPGAVGYLNEYECDRAFVAWLVDAFDRAGFGVTDCSNEAGDAQSELACECAAANASGADVFMAIHFNAGGGTGSEVWHYPGDSWGAELASGISARLAGVLGLPDRGAKAADYYYVLNGTDMTALIVEVCFVDRAEDADAWHGASWDALCDAIVGALGGDCLAGCGGDGGCAGEVGEVDSGCQDDGGGAGDAEGGCAEEGDFCGGVYRCAVDCLNVRDAPSLAGAVVASYGQGDAVELDDWYEIADGYVWGRYTAYSGNVRYVAVGRATGSVESDDFLVLC
jgi:hypothetical protein